MKAADLSGLPVVDAHCHPFAPAGVLKPAAFTDLLAWGGGTRAYMAAGGVHDTIALRAELQALKRDTIYFRAALRLLAEFFGCPPDLDAVLAARNAAVAADYPGYVRRLFETAGLARLVVDFGYPLPAIPVDRFAFEVPVPVTPLYRIEPLIAELLDADLDWDEFVARYDATIAAALQHEGYRGLKSIIAYRTGLDIAEGSANVETGRRAFKNLRRPGAWWAMKHLRDHLLCRALALCQDYDVPMQIHTGVGDWEVNLPLARPALLLEVLRSPRYRGCKVVLVHAGYPYQAEAGYLARVLPRVYVDVSEGVPFAAGAARRIFAEVLELAPPSKVVYGSDGSTLPEVNYVGAVLGKRALAAALADLVDGGLLAAEDAPAIAAGILAENALRLYGLQS